MKKGIALIVLAAVLLSLFACSTPVNDPTGEIDATEATDNVNPQDFLNLITNGTSEYVIVRGKEASATEITAAKDLQKYLKEISGCELPIVTDDSAPVGKEIVIGKTSREDADAKYAIDLTNVGTDGYVLKVVDEKFFISGDPGEGAMYGVYSFLEDYLGVKYYAVDCKIVPQSATVKVPSNLNKSYTPPLFIRDVFWRCSARDIEWSVFNKTNYFMAENAEDVKADYGQWEDPELAHTFSWRVPEGTYMSTHPEYFALDESGKRNGGGDGSLCLTNDDVVTIAANHVINEIKNDTTGRTVFNVSQDDNGVWCHCENCLKVIEEEGGAISGLNVRFVNKVAREVAKVYPDVYISTLAYAYTDEPCITKPDPNVMIVLCSSNYCFSHPFEECNYSPTRREYGKSFAEVLQGWGKLTDKIYVWDYTVCFRHYLAPFANYDSLQQNMQFMVENGVIGLRSQGDHHNHYSAEFGELKAYLFAKMHWNPYIDYDAETKSFLKAFYGDGWEKIYEYIMLVSETTDDIHCNTVSMPVISMLSFTSKQERQADKMWDEAEEAVKDNDIYLTRVRRSRIHYEMWKLCAGRYVNAEYLTHISDLVKTINDLGITHGFEAGGDVHVKIETLPERW